MFTRRILAAFFVLFLIIILIMGGCCMLPTSTTHTITATAGANGSIEPEGAISITEGSNQTFNITPDEGYEIADVLVDGVSVGQVSTYTLVNVEQNHTIEVSFKQISPSAPTVIRYTITATTDTGGSIVPEGSVKVSKGGNRTFTITPLLCYQINDVLVDGVSVGTVDTYTFEDVQQNHTIQVSFVDSGLGIYNIDKDQNYQSIQAAILGATDGDTIIVCPGTYYENIVFAGKNITVRSADPSNPDIVAATIIDGGGNDHVVRFTEDDAFVEDTSTLEGFTIQNGSASYGGGIYVWESHPTITGNTITGNTASSAGGGIHVTSYSHPTITGNTITGNTASYGGGMSINDSNPTITGNIISINTVTNRGGGIDVDECSPTITGNTITGNIASDSGGGICLSVSSFDITGNTITGNTASSGGGIAMYGQSNPTISENTINSNTVTNNGGGIYINHSDSTITDNNIKYNSATSGGGIGLDDNSSPTIDGNNINDNSSTSGGGIYMNNSNPTINGNNINDNSSTYGGGIYMNNSNPTINGNSIEYNDAVFGGGIDVSYSDPIIENNDFIGNKASFHGGGIYLNNFSDLLPATDRPTGWGIGREDIPTGDPLDPAEGVVYTIAGNEFVGNEHGDPLAYTISAHVYFD
jgi:parallel beta-helix repeat protein